MVNLGNKQMRNSLNKISDRFICGSSQQVSPVPLNDPLCQPLRDAGVTFCCTATFSASYHLIRDGKEKPYHYTAWFVMDGQFEFQLPDQTVDLGPGMVFLLPSWLPRSIRLVSGSDQTHLAFKLSLDGVREWFKTDVPIIRHTMIGQRLNHAVEGLTQETTVASPSAVACSHYCDLILHYLKLELQEQSPRLDEVHLQLSNLLQMIRGRLNEKWEVAAMAGALYICRAQLFRIMKRYFQTTPNQFLLTERMKLARQLLTETDYSLEIIAEQVGYANPYTFSNVFLKHVGIRPGAYRKGRGSRIVSLES